MIEEMISNIRQELSEVLNEKQMKLLLASLRRHLSTLNAQTTTDNESQMSNWLPLFISAKRVEGCSEKSLRYYESTIRNMLEKINKPERKITTEDLRLYLDNYQRRGTVSKVTLDNVRRISLSFRSSCGLWMLQRNPINGLSPLQMNW